MKNDKVYIDQILDSVRKIEDFTLGLGKEDFLKDSKTQSAIILQLVIIGELSKKISEDTKSKISLPWKDIAGFRDMAVHDYFQLDVDIVWNSIKADLVVLKDKLS